MVIVTGELRVAPEKMDRLRPLMRTVITANRKEDGCLLFAFGEDVLEPGLIRIVERWRDWGLWRRTTPRRMSSRGAPR